MRVDDLSIADAHFHRGETRVLEFHLWGGVEVDERRLPFRELRSVRRVNLQQLHVEAPEIISIASNKVFMQNL
jgi:hypothetical protein